MNMTRILQIVNIYIYNMKYKIKLRWPRSYHDYTRCFFTHTALFCDLHLSSDLYYINRTLHRDPDLLRAHYTKYNTQPSKIDILFYSRRDVIRNHMTRSPDLLRRKKQYRAHYTRFNSQIVVVKQLSSIFDQIVIKFF